MSRSRTSPMTLASVATIALLASAALPVVAQTDATDAAVLPATTLPDLSGLAVLDADHLLAVHDAKSPDEDDRPRASLLTLTRSGAGVTWEPVSIEWPADHGPSSDLEAASDVPGSPLVVLAESGDDGSDHQHLFLVEVDRSTSPPTGSVVGLTTWPDPAFNMEGMTIGRVRDELVILYAERAQGQTTSTIRWAPLSLEPFAIGEPSGVDFTSPAADGPNDRPVTAMEVAPDGRVFVASAFDPDVDDGPFSSSVWLAARLRRGDESATVRVRQRPRRLATLDGLKVESLALVQGEASSELYVGTDDENYGGVLRPVPR